MGFTGFRLASSSYTIGIPVGRFSSMMAASDIPGKKRQADQQTEQRECNGYSNRLSGAQLGRQEGQESYIIKEVSRENVFIT